MNAVSIEVRDARDRAMLRVQQLQSRLSRYLPAAEVREQHAKVADAIEAYVAACETQEAER